MTLLSDIIYNRYERSKNENIISSKEEMIKIKFRNKELVFKKGISSRERTCFISRKSISKGSEYYRLVENHWLPTSRICVEEFEKRTLADVIRYLMNDYEKFKRFKHWTLASL